MSIFGLSQEAQAKTRQNITQGVLIGGSLAGAGSVVIAAIELIKSHPDKGFALLEKWGPWFFLAMFSVWAARDLLTRALDAFTDVGDRFATAMDRIADEQKELARAGRDQAIATQAIADKDDRERERMATQLEYVGTRSRETADNIRDMQPVLAQMAAQLNQLSKKTDG